MQRSELHIFLLFLIVSWLFVSCSSSSVDTNGVEYNVEVSFDTDSTIVTDNVYLFVDNHRRIMTDTISLSRSRVGKYSGTTAGTDELYLMLNDGYELCHFYATPGSTISINVSGSEDSLVIDYTSPTDTINSWLQQHNFTRANTLVQKDWSKQAQQILDSLKACGENSLRTVLLLRDYMPYLHDSIYVRKYMGGIAESGRPDWLIKSIDLLYPQLRPSSDLGRLTAAQFQMNDTTIAINTSSRSDYMLLYFWGDYSKASVDSLKSLTRRIDKEYSDKRLLFLSFCVSAPDSTWWNNNIKDLPTGHHTLLVGGLADPRISAWTVKEIPYIIGTDMFTNIQNRNFWNEDLTKFLNKVPRRSNIASPHKLLKR